MTRICGRADPPRHQVSADSAAALRHFLRVDLPDAEPAGFPMEHLWLTSDIPSGKLT